MRKNSVLKGLLGLSAVAALFAALAVQAQTATDSGARQGSTGQAGQSGHSGQGMQGSPAKGDSAAQDSTAQGSTAPGSTASGSGATLSSADKKLVISMAQANMAEVEAGRMAQSKSQSDQVKNFAQQMIDDHTKALSDVQQLAQAKGVTLPTELDKTHKAKADKLAAMSGDAFDRAYLAQAGVNDHKKNHRMLRQAKDRARDPDLKALAARLLPTVDQHLHSAQQLHGTHSAKSKTQDKATVAGEKKG